MKNTIEIYCFCGEGLEMEIDLPDTWTTRYGSISHENAFCPKHAKVHEFAESQCPSCVGGWGDCNLFHAFAYSRNRNLSEDDFSSMRRGICPKRTNGTFSFDSRTGEFEDFSLAEQATSESGIALEQAIREYWAKYPEKD